MAAAIVSETTRIHARAGSMVASLHEAAQIAEQWSVLDNLSPGRVGLALASGWSKVDFWPHPDRFGRRHEITLERLREVRRLWSGESLVGIGPDGRELGLTVLPRPSNDEIPLPLTTTGDAAAYAAAGAEGFGILTHLPGQSTEHLAANIRTYRAAAHEAGNSQHGEQTRSRRISVTLHTLLTDRPAEGTSVPCLP